MEYTDAVLLIMSMNTNGFFLTDTDTEMSIEHNILIISNQGKWMKE